MPIVLSGSLELTGSVVATGNFTTTGNITAQTLVVQTITSSIVNVTGSNIFGSQISNRQTFTGSFYQTGSLAYFSNCVGIGTTTPYAPLQVTGSIKIANGNAQGILGLGEANGSTINVGLWRGAANAPTTDGNYLNVGGYDGIILAASNAAIGSQCERMRITSDGVVSINCNASFAKGAKLQILQSSSNTNAIDFKNTDATYGHIGTFANNLYLTQNYYYAGGQNNDSATYGQASITMGVSNVAGDTSIDFSMSDPGATSPSSKMRLFSVGCGVLLVGTTTCTAEASLVLGAKGANEGGQLVLQKGTACSCATHLDNYNDSFRVLVGTDTGTNGVHMLIDHKTRNTCFYGSVLSSAPNNGHNFRALGFTTAPIATGGSCLVYSSLDRGLYLISIASSVTSTYGYAAFLWVDSGNITVSSVIRQACVGITTSGRALCVVNQYTLETACMTINTLNLINYLG